MEEETVKVLPLQSSELLSLARKIVTKDVLSTLTMRSVRRSMEERLSLPEGTLDDVKDKINKIVNKVISEVESGVASDSGAEAKPKNEKEKPKKRSKSRNNKSDNDEAGSDDDEEADTASKQSKQSTSKAIALPSKKAVVEETKNSPRIKKLKDLARAHGIMKYGGVDSMGVKEAEKHLIRLIADAGHNVPSIGQITKDYVAKVKAKREREAEISALDTSLIIEGKRRRACSARMVSYKESRDDVLDDESGDGEDKEEESSDDGGYQHAQAIDSDELLSPKCKSTEQSKTGVANIDDESPAPVKRRKLVVDEGDDD